MYDMMPDNVSSSCAPEGHSLCNSATHLIQDWCLFILAMYCLHLFHRLWKRAISITAAFEELTLAIFPLSVEFSHQGCTLLQLVLWHIQRIFVHKDNLVYIITMSSRGAFMLGKFKEQGNNSVY